MTKHDAMLGVLRLGALTEPELRDICGWPREVLAEVIADLMCGNRIKRHSTNRGMYCYLVA